MSAPATPLGDQALPPELAPVIRSKNAGPFIYTFDILFRDAGTFERVREAGHLDRAAVAGAYGISAN